jgi:hypothetical protein
MSDKVELIAAAQVYASSSGISFNSNSGFKTIAKNGTGSYELSLDDKHDAKKLVISVGQDTGSPGSIVASPLGTGDVRNIQVVSFDGSNSPIDVPFYISILRVR